MTSFIRIDALSPNAPARFVSSIVVDPTNPDHAWISYSGYKQPARRAGAASRRPRLLRFPERRAPR